MPRLGIGLRRNRDTKKALPSIFIPTVSIQDTPPPVSNGGSFTVTFVRDGPTSAALDFDYSVTANTVNAADMAAGAGAFGTFSSSFAIGSTSRSITITTANDPTGEVNEDFAVAIEPSVNFIVGDPASVTCVILGPPVLPAVSIDSVVAGTEGVSNATVTFRRTTTSGTLDLTYSVGSSTDVSIPTVSADEIQNGFGNRVVQFADTQATVTATIVIIDDATVEFTEGFNVGIVAQPSLYTISGSPTTTILVYDNEPPGPQFESTTSQTSATVTLPGGNIVFNFNTAMPVGYFVNGDPFVVTRDGGFNVTSISPASANDGTYQYNGAELNPVVWDTSAQGFDGVIAVAGSISAGATYSAALNVDPGANAGAPIVFAQGSSGSIYKTVRRIGTPDWQNIDRVGVLTVLPQYPLAGPFRPGFGKTSKNIPGYKSQINYNVLRSLSAGYTCAQGLAAYPRTVAKAPTGGEKHRRYQTDNGLAGTSSSSYAGNYASGRLRALHALHGTESNAVKEELMIRCIQAGIDAIGDNPTAGSTGGSGQWHGVLWCIYLAAFALGDANMLSIAKSRRENMNGQHFWVKNVHVGQNQSFGGGNHGYNNQPFYPEQIGFPEFAAEVDNPEFPPKTDSSSLITSDYRSVSCPPGYLELFMTLLLQNGPGGQTGVTALLNDGPFDTTNQAAAAVAYMDRFRTMDGAIGQSAAAHRTFYDQNRDTAFIGTAIENRWKGPPEILAPDTGCVTLTPVSSPAGRVSYSFGTYGVGLTTSPITQYDMRYSIDQKNWVEVLNCGTSGNVDGLMVGGKVYFQFRRTNVYGTSPWSPNFSISTTASYGNTERTVTIPTGTPANAAPTNTVVPYVVISQFPIWGGPSWISASATLPDDLNIVTIGNGMWTGFPFPTFKYQWRRNTTPITDATNDWYMLVAADRGQVIDCVVTATNSQGSTNATSIGYTVPSTTTLTKAAYYSKLETPIVVNCASTGNLTLSGLQTVDTYVGTTGTTVLAKDQTTASQNGIWVMAAGAWTRDTRFDTWDEVVGGRVQVFSPSKTTDNGGLATNKGKIFNCSNATGGTIGSTNITFVTTYFTPPNMTFLWDGQAGIPIPLTATGINTLSLAANATATPGLRFYSLDFLQPKGALTSVTEGGVSFTTKGASNASGNQIGFIIYATGASVGAANCYYIGWDMYSGGIAISVYRYSAGTGTLVASGNIGGTTLDPVNGFTANTDATALLKWYVSGTSLVIQAKAWKTSVPTGEPAWMINYTDTSPLTAGKIGYAARFNKVTRTVSNTFLDFTPSFTATTQEEASLAGFYY